MSKNLPVLHAGGRTNAARKPVSNIILLSITDSEYDWLRPRLEYVDLANHLVLHEAGGRGGKRGLYRNTGGFGRKNRSEARPPEGMTVGRDPSSPETFYPPDRCQDPAG